MTYESFISRRGFTEDPFAFTDSDRENRLSDYFVPPPYFAGVMGTPSSPEPSIVFAPRGGGKSAQRRMVEEASQDLAAPFLCITYSNFESVGGTTPSIAEHHLALSRLLTLAMLSELQADETGVMYLDEHERQVLKVAAQVLLSSLTADEFRIAMSSIKTVGDKAGELWRKYGGVVAVAIAALLAQAGMKGVNLPAGLVAQAESLEASAQYFFVELIKMSKKLAWQSVYILIDRVDETTATVTNPSAAFELISTLATNLPTLELPGVGFKFFLWDQLRPMFLANGGRTDRVMVFELHWTVPELVDMLTKRLEAFSGGAVHSFNELLAPVLSLNLHLLLANLCYGSPRDMIRMAKQIIAEATRSDGTAENVSADALWAGIFEFSKKRTTELYGKFESDFSKFQEISFVTSKLSSDIFRISDNAMRQKLQQWTEVGAIRKMTELATGKNRPAHVYTFTDLRVAIGRGTVEDVELVLDNFAIQCPRCGRIVIGSDKSLVCECGTTVKFTEQPSLLQVCTD